MVGSRRGTLRGIVFDGGQDPSAVALLGTEGRVITYGGLRGQMARLVGGLDSMGFRKGQRLAILMPNGFSMAIALISVMAGFTCAPLDANIRGAELERRLTEMKITGVITNEESGKTFANLSKELGIEYVGLKTDRSGSLGLAGFDSGEHEECDWAGEEDTVLLLQTSGTTATPKLVGLTNNHVAYSVAAIKDFLGLKADDRCLCMMPLFHVHGQIMALASVASGGSVVCAPRFDPFRFVSWLLDFDPTWYSAVPTIHRAVCDLPRSELARAKGRLRFIRSASSALPLQLLRELEGAFGVPVIEAYGMTEASHGIASNPLPPLMRKAGSVGLPLPGVEVAIIGEGGKMLGLGKEGEVVVRGVNIIEEYLDSPEANARSFVDGWLRTGDLGYRDRDGYIFLTGRAKDIINRGGEKIAPREIEEALLGNPSVSEAIVFPVPHPTLGEDVAAAVVLRAGHLVGEKDLREWLSLRLSGNKMPQSIHILGEIPKGPTGKPRRPEMAKIIAARIQQAPPAGGAGAELGSDLGGVPNVISSIWGAVLRKVDIGPNERFLEAGGDSLRAIQVIARVRDAFGVELEVADIFEADTIALQAGLVRRKMRERGMKQEKGL